MEIFEYPYIIITIFVFSFIVLGGIGLFFALKGIKAANDVVENDFSSVKKLENNFERWGRRNTKRCLIYISVSLDNIRRLYSNLKAQNIFNEIKPILLQTFFDLDSSQISLYDQNNFIVLNDWDIEKTRKNIEECINHINKCLLKFEAINIVTVEFGFYDAIAANVTFDEAINRAKQASMIAENENLPYVEWDSAIGKSIKDKISIENNIESEINNNHFFLEYQPMIDANTKKIIGAEVLSRLNSENNGIVFPRGFLSAVDSVGLNEKFDYYIFEKNCKWISNNKEEREQYKYTINFSRSTLCDESFSQKIIEIIEKYNLKYSSLAIEILEDKDITGVAKKNMISNLSKLKAKGISILLDDFGSGYTTFSDLQNFDIDIVKIDKSIIKNSDTEAGVLILKNIVRTAKDLGFKTMCEGVETEAQEKAAIDAGCDVLQGFYFYRPMPVSRLEKIFEENNEV